jgi:copper chaperone
MLRRQLRQGRERRHTMSKTILSVEGMSCPSCIAHVSEALAMRGVANVDVLFDEGAVAIEHDETVSSGRLIAALQNAGYEATPRKAS